MSRAIQINRVTILLLAAMTAAAPVCAAGKKAPEPARKAAEVATQVTAASDSQPSQGRSAKGDRATSRPAVSNAYEVPLIKNAGSLPAPR